MKINNVIDSAEIVSMLKMHIRDWEEKVPGGSITVNGNEKTIVKRIKKTQAKLITDRLFDLLDDVCLVFNIFCLLLY